jgi:uncharacterized protein (TIGR03437 family)
MLPTSLGGVKVLVGAKPAVISYIGPTQINAIAPPDTSTGQVEVDVVTSNGMAVTTAQMANTSPALFTYTARGNTYAVAQFATDYAIVGALDVTPGVTSRPANAGDNLLLYATALGQTNPPYPFGQVLVTAYPVADLSQLSALVAGQSASVLYAGMTYPGVFQINIQVPSGVPAGDQPLVIRLGAQTSQPGVYLTFSGF